MKNRRPPVALSKLTNADATLTTETRGNDNNIYHGGGGHGGMRWQKADGGEDDLVSLSNNLSGRGKEGGGVNDAQVVGGGNNSHSEAEAQIDGGRGKVCKFFSRGDCKNGDKCPFRHDIDQGILKRGRGKGCTKRRNTERSNRQSNGGREGKRQRSWRK
jgi:hypothetical protein